MHLLYPSDAFKPRLVDEALRDEATAFIEAGHTVTAIDIDSLSFDADGALRGIKEDGPFLYRGWMLSDGSYAAMANALEHRGGMITSPAQYRAAHQLPRWYDAIAGHTPKSVWTSGDPLHELVPTAQTLKKTGPVVLKDYVKSEKHRWLEAAFVPDVADTERLLSVGSKLLEYRGENFVGGFVIRDFETFVGAEYRTWWMNGELRLISAHPDTSSEVPDHFDVSFLSEAVATLALPFITVDVVRDSSGNLRVVEIGDGQVSDRPDSTSTEVFVAALSI